MKASIDEDTFDGKTDSGPHFIPGHLFELQFQILGLGN
jgi:hypothetical protein